MNASNNNNNNLVPNSSSLVSPENQNLSRNSSSSSFSDLQTLGTGPVEPERYNKLLQEYGKAKKNNSVLKKAVLEEKEKATQLQVFKISFFHFHFFFIKFFLFQIESSSRLGKRYY